MFAGLGGWSASVNCRGHPCFGLDNAKIDGQSEFIQFVDLTDVLGLEALLRAIVAKLIIGIGNADPCGTFSLARRAKDRQPGKRGGFPARL